MREPILDFADTPSSRLICTTQAVLCLFPSHNTLLLTFKRNFQLVLIMVACRACPQERISRERSEGGGEVSGAQMSSIPTYKHTFVSSLQGSQVQPRSVVTDIVSTRGAGRVNSLVPSTTNLPPDVLSTQPATQRPLQSTFTKSHKKVTAHAIETEVPNLPSEDGNSGDDSRAPLLQASTAPQASFSSLKNFKPSNPFAKKVNAPKAFEEKNESILLSLKKMHSEPEEKRKAGSVPSQQRPRKLGKAG